MAVATVIVMVVTTAVTKELSPTTVVAPVRRSTEAVAPVAPVAPVDADGGATTAGAATVRARGGDGGSWVA